MREKRGEIGIGSGAVLGAQASDLLPVGSVDRGDGYPRRVARRPRVGVGNVAAADQANANRHEDRLKGGPFEPYPAPTLAGIESAPEAKKLETYSRASALVN